MQVEPCASAGILSTSTMMTPLTQAGQLQVIHKVHAGSVLRSGLDLCAR